MRPTTYQSRSRAKEMKTVAQISPLALALSSLKLRFKRFEGWGRFGNSLPVPTCLCSDLPSDNVSSGRPAMRIGHTHTPHVCLDQFYTSSSGGRHASNSGSTRRGLSVPDARGLSCVFFIHVHTLLTTSAKSQSFFESLSGIDHLRFR